LVLLFTLQPLMNLWQSITFPKRTNAMFLVREIRRRFGVSAAEPTAEQAGEPGRA
jgi:hypothetical protein